MERPIPAPLNSPVSDLDTPALVVDKDQVMTNHKVFSAKILDIGSVLIPDVSIHSSVGITLMQTGGDRNSQIHCRTLACAEIFNKNGFSNIIIDQPAPNEETLTRLKNLSRITSLKIDISNSYGITEIVKTINKSGITVNVNLSIAQSIKSRGFIIGNELLTTISLINATKELSLTGFTIVFGQEDPKSISNFIELLKRFIANNNLQFESGNHFDIHLDSVADFTNITESNVNVVNGDYLFNYVNQSNGENNSCWVLSTVMSHPESGRWYLDCGQKAISTDRGFPKIINEAPLEIETMSAEHGYAFSRTGEHPIKLGDRIKLIPANYADTFNLYDFINISSKDRLTNILRVDSRGALN